MNRPFLLLSVALAIISPAAVVRWAAAAQPEMAEAPRPDFSRVPGTVIYHSPAASGIYIGSPGIAILPDGAYLAKLDEFGPGSTEWTAAVTRVFRSEDRGGTWRPVARLEGLFWASLFTHGEAAWLLGTEKHHGRIVVRRSTDGGRTWTTPRDSTSGLLTESGEYHTAPVPVVVHQGRLWRAMEDAMGGTRWGERYRAFMMSIPVDADLLEATNWVFSNRLSRDGSWLEGQFRGWLEGNAVGTPAGELVNILRVDVPQGGKAAVIRIDAAAQTASFDPESDFIDFPGGAKKFTIRFDPESERYWSLANVVPPAFSGPPAAGTRNTLALVSSTDLRGWHVRCLLLHHADRARHGFQYPDWVFDGPDLVAAIRTAYDDGLGGAHNAHDANFLTFHRFKGFRRLTPADSVVDPAALGMALSRRPTD